MEQADRHQMNEVAQSRYTNFQTFFFLGIINLKHQSKRCFSILAGGNTEQYWRISLAYFRFSPLPFNLSFWFESTIFNCTYIYPSPYLVNLVGKNKAELIKSFGTVSKQKSLQNTGFRETPLLLVFFVDTVNHLGLMEQMSITLWLQRDKCGNSLRKVGFLLNPRESKL